MVSVLGDYTYEFPEEFPLELRLKDMLEDSVDEKFYLSDAMINYCIGVGQKNGKFPRKERFLQNLNREHQNIGNAITTVQKDSLVAEPKIIEDFYKNRDERIYEGIAPTLRSERIGLKVAEPLAYDEQNGYIRKDGTVGTLTTDGSSPKHNNRVVENLRIRKLTPKECWRLMGFDDFDFDKAAAVNSNSQLYKQAGNSIVVDVLCYIFGKML
jgi:DNA (cytosine-5)-methyltransferase 1